MVRADRAARGETARSRPGRDLERPISGGPSWSVRLAWRFVQTHELLAAYDDQLREEGEFSPDVPHERHGPVLWVHFPRRGFVTYRDLGGLRGEALDEVVAATVAHFRDSTPYDHVEWKTRGHDGPADLGARLEAHAFVAEEVETVMVGEASLLAVDVPLPDGVVVRRAGQGGDVADDLRRLLDMQESVFGDGRGPRLEDVVRAERSGEEESWLAEASGEVVAGGRLAPVPGTTFAGLWGGATLPGWRGRGVYRALTAARARSALARGVRLLHSDCTAMSRPILERAGLVAVTTTTPYVWQR